MPIHHPIGGQFLRAGKRSGGTRVGNQTGVFCISVDTQLVESDSATVAQRRQDLVDLLNRQQMPSNWTTAMPPQQSVPAEIEATLAFPLQISRADLVSHVRRMNASLLGRGGSGLAAVVLDPHEARAHWDVLVRQGCTVVRPRTMTASKDTAARIVRGGLWVAPLSCSFVGGSRRSVRALFSVCQRHLVAATSRHSLFHLNIDIGNSRGSWKEELEALRALLQTASELRNQNRLRCAKLSELPGCLSRKPAVPMKSVLRRAA